MKKKVISAALAGTLAVSLLSACGASNEPQNISDVSVCQRILPQKPSQPRRLLV